jgi:SAM-dependent methyltransferase
VHGHFLHSDLPKTLLRTAKANRSDVIADLGAGDGAMLWALDRRGLLGETAYAVDISPTRVARAVANLPRIKGLVADATDVKALADSSVDGVIASQVIEHLADDRKLAPEIARILKPGGWWYVGTVLRMRHAWWFYRVDGVWRLDPTHVREYLSEHELLGVLSHPELVVNTIEASRLKFPVSDLVFRAAAYLKLLPQDELGTIYSKNSRLAALRRLQTPVPRFRLLEVVGQRLPPSKA